MICCIFGSKTPKEFKAPQDLMWESTSVPVLATKDSIQKTLFCPSNARLIRRIWREQPTKTNDKTRLFGSSVGVQEDMEQAGTFEFYGVDDNQALYSFIAAQCTPTATQESVIDSPSTLELTCRYCYLQSLIEHSKLKPEVTEELRSFRRAAVRDESEEGCMHDGESYKVLGQAFGKVREISTSYKIGVLEQHNELLRKVHSTCFELPSYAEVKKAEARSAEIKGAEASSVTAQVSSAEASSARTLSISEWCCFEVEKDR